MKKIHGFAVAGMLLLGCKDGRQAPAPPPTPASQAEPVRTGPPSPPATPAKVFERKVLLKIEKSTWRDEAPFAIEAEIGGKLEAEGVQAVSGDVKADGTVLITYHERKGNAYSFAQGMQAVEYGTTIDCRVKVVPAGQLEDMGPFFYASGISPKQADWGGLYSAALNSFKSDPHWIHAGRFVAAAIGVRDSLPKLMPLVREERSYAAAQLLKDRGYSAGSAEDMAYLAAGRWEYDECARIGALARPVLLRDLRAWKKEQDERESSSPSLKPVDEQMLKALLAVNGRDAAPILLEVIRKFAGTEGFSFHPALPYSNERVLIGAYGDLGDSSGLELMDVLSRCGNPKVADVARTAAEKIRSRGGK